MPRAEDLSAGTLYTAADPWDARRPESLVICCSDGRWHAQVEEFVRDRVSSRADMYAIPGGPAALCPRSSSFYTRKVAEDALDFLAEHHRLEFLWLIAHQDCAWYRTRYEFFDQDEIKHRQWDDLEAVARTVEARHSEVTVRRVYAALDGGRVTFIEPPPLAATGLRSLGRAARPR
jgi:hypothetical protein